MREGVAPPLPLQSLSHLSRVVRDVERSIDFYTNVLGFREIKRPSSFDFEGSWCVSVCDPVAAPLKRPSRPFDRCSAFGLTFLLTCRLIGYGTSIHLIQGSPVRKPRPITPSDDHTSFQASPILLSPFLRHVSQECLCNCTFPLCPVLCSLIDRSSHRVAEKVGVGVQPSKSKSHVRVVLAVKFIGRGGDAPESTRHTLRKDDSRGEWHISISGVLAVLLGPFHQPNNTAPSFRQL